MKKSIKLSLLLFTLITLFSCGGAGLSPKTYYVEYTNSEGKQISAGGNDITYSYWSPTHENTFFGVPSTTVLFQIESGATPDNIVGKEISVMITKKSDDEFDESKAFKCKVESFDYVKKGMFDDKVYKLKGTFNTNEYKNGKLCLQVYM